MHHDEEYLSCRGICIPSGADEYVLADERVVLMNIKCMKPMYDTDAQS